MKISLLKEREDFYKIFVCTIEKYLSNKLAKKVVIEKFNHRGAIKFNVNEELNIIYPQSIKRKELNSLVQEFTWNKNWIKRLLQKAYAYVAIRFPFELILSRETLYFEGAAIEIRNCVFIPGNHSIRIIDVFQNTSTVIAKDGFNAEFLFKDAELRLAYSTLNVPYVLSLNKERRSYVEERISGLPLNRLASELTKANVLQKTQSDLASLYQASLAQIDGFTYVQKLSKDILRSTQDFLKSEELPTGHTINTLVKTLLKLLYSFDINVINICETHGDFQPANILCNADKFWIIDWEYSKPRSIFYDALTFDLEARFDSGLSRRLNLLSRGLNSGESYYEWTGQRLTQNSSFYLFLFLLEDIFLRIEELSSLSVAKRYEKLCPYLFEISKFIENK